MVALLCASSSVPVLPQKTNPLKPYFAWIVSMFVSHHFSALITLKYTYPYDCFCSNDRNLFHHRMHSL